jgi:excisionase family DNA binding protein
LKRELKILNGAVQKHEVVIINRPFVSPQKKCDRCAELSGMITPDEAAALCEVSTRTVYRWLETGAIHFSETFAEGLLICLNSLAATNTSQICRHSESDSRIKR